jgi:hypothetical protein
MRYSGISQPTIEIIGNTKRIMESQRDRDEAKEESNSP